MRGRKAREGTASGNSATVVEADARDDRAPVARDAPGLARPRKPCAWTLAKRGATGRRKRPSLARRDTPRGRLPAAWAATALFMALCRAWRPLAAQWTRAVIRPAASVLHLWSARFPFPLFEPLLIMFLAALAVCVLVGGLAALSTMPFGRTRRAGKSCRAERARRLWQIRHVGRTRLPGKGAFLRSARRIVAGLLLVPCAGYAALWYPACMAAREAGRTFADMPGFETNPTAFSCDSVPSGPDAVDLSESARLAALCSTLIDALNASPLDFPPAEAILARAPAVAGRPGARVKSARWPLWMERAGVSGLFAPWTGEVILRTDLPAPLLPFTAVHELMHLSGIADEGAANIAAWARCARAGGAFADSARLWTLGYALALLCRADPAAARAVASEIKDPLRRLLPFPGSAGARRPDPFTRALGLDEITQSYDRLALWLAGHMKGSAPLS